MRRLTDGDLERLESFLKGLGDEAMFLSELDGYLAGVIVCPETIPPSEWLPSVWGSDDPTFENKAEMEEVFAILMAFYNAIGHALSRTDAYVPHLEIDGTGSTIWELWASGFGRAVDLRPWAWKNYETAPEDDPEAQALRLLLLLAEAADTPGGLDLPETLERSLREAGDGVLAACVIELHRGRLAAVKAERPAKVGRNDPCPCGSGKKYKKCCGQADIT